MKVRSAVDRRLVHVFAGVVTKIDEHVVHLAGDYSDEVEGTESD